MRTDSVPQLSAHFRRFNNPVSAWSYRKLSEEVSHKSSAQQSTGKLHSTLNNTIISSRLWKSTVL